MSVCKSRNLRAALSAGTILTILLGGCAGRQSVVPIGQDRAEFLATIARRGEERPVLTDVHEPEEPDRFDSPALQTAAQVAGSAAAVGLYCACFVPLCYLAALGHGSIAGLRPDLATTPSGSQ